MVISCRLTISKSELTGWFIAAYEERTIGPANWTELQTTDSVEAIPFTGYQASDIVGSRAEKGAAKHTTIGALF